MRSHRNLLLVTVLSAVHAVGLVLILEDPAALFDGRPILDQDWGLHFHHLTSLAGFRESGRLWGYNPYFMAGYPSNTFQDLSIKFFELAALATPGASPIQAFKGWVFLAAAAVPWLCYLTFVNLFAGGGAAGRAAGSGGLVAALLGTAYWWGSLPREMFFYGMVGFPAASYLGWLALSLLKRVVERPLGGRRFSALHLAWLAAASILLPVHLQGAVLLLLPGAVLLVAHRSARGWLWAAAGVAAAVAVNLFWLVPFLSHLGDQAAREVVDRLPLFLSHDPWTWLKDYLTGERYWTFRASRWEKVLRLVLLLLGALGLARLFRRRRALALALLAALVPLFLLAYFGSFADALAPWQPLRFKVPLDVLLALLAGRAVRPPDRRAPAAARRVAGGLLVVGLLAAAGSVVATEAAGEMRLQTTIRPPVDRIVDWLAAADPASGRVLFEESGDETGFVYNGMYLSAFLPRWTGHQLIGGPINLYADRHHWAELHSGRLFGRDVATFDDRGLREYLRLYNVAWVVAFDPRTVARLRRLGGLVEPAANAGGIVMARVHQPRSWFVRGNGRVRADYDRIECSEVEGSEVILKYHWVAGLQISSPTLQDPPLTIEPVHLLEDPIPFIRIVDPPERFTLSIGRPPRL